MLDTQIKSGPTVPKLHAIKPVISPAPHARSINDSHQLWLHIHLQQFSLDILTPGNADRHACVLVEAQGKRVQVISTNSYASHLGIRVGMSLAAAKILGQITVLKRDERAEQKSLERLCAWANQFTPVVSAVDGDGLLLEIRGSLKLFGGVDELLNRVRRGLRELGYRPVMAIAPTPLAATALARSEQQKIVLSKDELTSALSALPLEVLRLDPRQLAVLNSIGARSIGDCLRLPRGGLGRRTAPQLMGTFQRLIGQAADPRVHFKLPKLFQSSLEIPWETSNAQSIAIAGERLLHELVGYLRSCASVTRSLRWSLNYSGGQVTHFRLELTNPSREHSHFMLLLREQLSRIKLDGQVKGLALYVDDITPDSSLIEGDLFKQRKDGGVEDWSGFLDRLRARLGEQSVRGLQRVADHRPEYAWRWSNVSPRGEHTSFSQVRPDLHAAERPLWLMRKPIRLSCRGGNPEIDGPLRFSEERERIETGWWDGKPIERDYFIASNPDGARLWVYRELTGEKHWYLHGIFE